MALKTASRWDAEIFAIGSVSEGESLSPEGQSSMQVFEFLSNSVHKIYEVYKEMSDFPLGLLIVLTFMHSLVLFEEFCQCGRQFDLSAEGFGLLVPQFRDMWIRPEFLSHYKHNMCQTQRDIDFC